MMHLFQVLWDNSWGRFLFSCKLCPLLIWSCFLCRQQPVARGFVFSGCLSVHPILVNAFWEFLQKHSLEFKDELIRFWWSKVKGQDHSALTKPIFALWMRYFHNSLRKSSHILHHSNLDWVYEQCDFGSQRSKVKLTAASCLCFLELNILRSAWGNVFKFGLKDEQIQIWWSKVNRWRSRCECHTYQECPNCNDW